MSTDLHFHGEIDTNCCAGRKATGYKYKPVSFPIQRLLNAGVLPRGHAAYDCSREDKQADTSSGTAERPAQTDRGAQSCKGRPDHLAKPVKQL